VRKKKKGNSFPLRWKGYNREEKKGIVCGRQGKKKQGGGGEHALLKSILWAIIRRKGESRAKKKKRIRGKK